MGIRSVRIIWEQTSTKGGGPKKKMWALHRALRRRMEQGLDWLEFGTRLKRGRLHWIWHVPMRHLALRLAKRNEPFLLGPNVLFENGLDGKLLDVDRQLLDASSCRVLFAHSDWQADLMRGRRGQSASGLTATWRSARRQRRRARANWLKISIASDGSSTIKYRHAKVRRSMRSAVYTPVKSSITCRRERGYSVKKASGFKNSVLIGAQFHAPASHFDFAVLSLC